MLNPLLHNNSITAIDYKTNEEIVVSKNEIGKYFKKIYCICPFSTIDYNILTQSIIEPSDLQKMVLYETNTTIVKNMIHYCNMIYCKSESFTLANHFKYNLDEMVLIIPFLNISFLNLQKYIDTINGDNNLDKLYNVFVLNNYFGENQKIVSNKLQLGHMIKTLKCSDYWKLYYNCKCNITKLFNQRNFNFSVLKPSKNKSITDVIDKLSNPKHCNGENYLEEIFKTKKYMDPSSILCKKGFKIYNVVKNGNYDKVTIYNLLSSIEDTSLRFLLYCQLAVSRDYCHLVVNSNIISMMDEYIYKYLNIVEYLFGYSWLRFYFEECISKYNMKTTDMFIFEIDTASKLPVFHFDYNNPQKNPYMPILVGHHSLNPLNNIGGVKPNGIKHRICNLNEFIERFNIFCCNDKDKYLFQCIDFDEYKMGITGSIMTACLQYHHPLLELFETKDISMNDLYNRFYNEYYCDADIDIMILTSDVFEFLNIGKKLHIKIIENICNLYDAEPNHVRLSINKQVYLFVTNEFIRNHIVQNELTEELIISNISSPSIVKLFIPYAEQLHAIEIEKNLSQYSDLEKSDIYMKHPEYFVFDSSNLVIKLYNKTINSTVNIKSKIEYSEEELEKILESNEDDKFINTLKMDGEATVTLNFKLRISAPQLDHDLEIFPIKKDDFMTTVGSFHMPCVRSYYNGTNVFLTPSCISAHMTFMNIDYKYFAGSKDPIEIINKYRMRGFGTWLNTTEITTFVKYSSMVPFWNNLYNINLSNKTTLYNCLGPLPINHKLFYPRQFNFDLYTNSKIRPIPYDEPYVNVSIRPEMTMNEYNIVRYKISIINFDKDYICSDTGYVKQLEMNIIDTISVYLNSTNITVQPESEDVD